ncbi:MAG: hypothetical protein ACM358_17035, partial [Gemmatimonadota bacterium]
MNEAQRQAIKARQRARVEIEPDERAPPQPAAPPLRPIEEIAAELRPDVGPGRPVKYLRFIDKTFQVAGLQSGDQLQANKQANGREHRIELVEIAGAGCFLITFIDPGPRKVDFDIVERSAVKTWKLA